MDLTKLTDLELTSLIWALESCSEHPSDSVNQAVEDMCVKANNEMRKREKKTRREV